MLQLTPIDEARPKVTQDSYRSNLVSLQTEITHSTDKINRQYVRNPDMAYVLKMEYVYKINIFGLKMMVKSGLEKIFLKSLCVQSLFRKIFLLHRKGDFAKKLQK